MHKTIIVVLLAIVLSIGTVYAGHNENCPENNPNCNQEGGDSSITITNNNDSSASATSRSSSNSVALSGSNSSSSANGGDATATAGSVSNSIKFEDKRDHVNPNQYEGPSVDLKDTVDKLRIKTKGSVYSMKTTFSYDEAHRLAKGASDVKVEIAVFADKKEKTKEILVSRNVSDYAEGMGYIYILPDGPDCTRAQMEGRLMEEAMKLGATHIIPVYDIGSYLNGSSWNIGIGGGASLIASGGTTALAPNGGTGYGKAKSNNEYRPAVLAELWFDSIPMNEYPYIPAE